MHIIENKQYESNNKIGWIKLFKNRFTVDS